MFSSQILLSAAGSKDHISTEASPILDAANIENPYDSSKPISLYNNPFKARHPWPPDFSKMSVKHQLRIERRYERRSRMKLIRPGWVKGTKIAQAILSAGVVIYGVFFLDWSEPVSAKGSTKSEASTAAAKA